MKGGHHLGGVYLSLDLMVNTGNRWNSKPDTIEKQQSDQA